MNEEYERNEEQFAKDLEAFEKLLKNNEVLFFDAERFEEFFDHYLTKNKISKAEKVINMALSQHPYSSELRLRKAQVLIRKKKYDDALNLLDEIQSVETHNPDIFLLKAEVYSDRGNHEKAVDSYLEALAFLEPEEHDYVYIDIANEYQNNSRFPEAIKYLKKAIRNNPYNDMAYLELLFCCQVCQEDEKERAAVFLENIINADPYNHLAWTYFGILMLELKRITEALEAFDLSITAKEDYVEGYLHKAETLMEMERYNDAAEVYKEVMQLEEPSAGVYFSLGECYENLSEFESAIHYYKLAISKEPDYSDAYMGIGIVLDQMGRSSEALPYLETAFRHDDSNLESILYYADIKKDLGIYHDALEIYDFLRAHELPWKDYWANYAETLYLTGKIEEAIEVIYEGVKNNPDDVELQYRWAAYQLLAGDTVFGSETLANAYEKDRTLLKFLLDQYPQLTSHSAVINLFNL